MAGRPLSSRLVPLGFLAIAIGTGCPGRTSTSDGERTPADAEGPIDAGATADARDAPDDALDEDAQDAADADDGFGTCGAVAPTDLLAPDVTDASSEPVASGGTIQSGTYVATSETVYPVPGADFSDSGTCRQRPFGERWVFVADPDGGSGTVMFSDTEGTSTVFQSDTYSTSGSTLSIAPTCFCALGGPHDGCSQPLQLGSVEYTATPTQVARFVSVGVECGMAVVVLTKQ
jgi:hypothetical protein